MLKEVRGQCHCGITMCKTANLGLGSRKRQLIALYVSGFPYLARIRGPSLGLGITGSLLIQFSFIPIILHQEFLLTGIGRSHALSPFQQWGFADYLKYFA
jgi:hypothetical protein